MNGAAIMATVDRLRILSAYLDSDWIKVVIGIERVGLTKQMQIQLDLLLY